VVQANGKRRNVQDLFFAHTHVKTAPAKRQKLNRNTINNGPPEPVETPNPNLPSWGCGRDAPRSQGRAGAAVSPEFIHIPNMFLASGVAQVGVARLYMVILVIFDGNRLRPAGGWSARRIYHDGPAPYAEGDRSLAG